MIVSDFDCAGSVLISIALFLVQLRRCLQSLESEEIPRFNRILDDFKLLPLKYKKDEIPVSIHSYDMPNVVQEMMYSLTLIIVPSVDRSLSKRTSNTTSSLIR